MALAGRHVGAGQARGDLVAGLALGDASGAGRASRPPRSRRPRRAPAGPARRAPRFRRRGGRRSARPPSRGPRRRARPRPGAPAPPTATPTPPARRPPSRMRACSSRMSASSACVPLPTSTSVSLRKRRGVTGPLVQAGPQHLGRVAALLEQPAQADDLEPQREAPLLIAAALQLGDAQRDARPRSGASPSYRRASASRAVSSSGACSCSGRQIRIAPGRSSSAVSVSSAARRSQPRRRSSDTRSRALSSISVVAVPIRSGVPTPTCSRTDSSTACAAASAAVEPAAGAVRRAPACCAARLAQTAEQIDRQRLVARAARPRARRPRAGSRGCRAARRPGASASPAARDRDGGAAAPRGGAGWATWPGRRRARLRARPRRRPTSWQWSKKDVAARACRSRRTDGVEAGGVARRP